MREIYAKDIAYVSCIYVKYFSIKYFILHLVISIPNLYFSPIFVTQIIIRYLLILCFPLQYLLHIFCSYIFILFIRHSIYIHIKFNIYSTLISFLFPFIPISLISFNDTRNIFFPLTSINYLTQTWSKFLYFLSTSSIFFQYALYFFFLYFHHILKSYSIFLLPYLFYSISIFDVRIFINYCHTCDYFICISWHKIYKCNTQQIGSKIAKLYLNICSIFCHQIFLFLPLFVLYMSWANMHQILPIFFVYLLNICP